VLVYKCMYIHIYHIYTYMYMDTYMCIHTCMYIHTGHVRVCIHTCISTYKYMNACGAVCSIVFGAVWCSVGQCGAVYYSVV